MAIAATRLELPTASLARTLFLGELGLDRKLHAIRGVLALLSAADDSGARQAVAPLPNLAEALHCTELSS